MRALANDAGFTHGKFSFIVSQLAVHRTVGHRIVNNFEFEDFADTY